MMFMKFTLSTKHSNKPNHPKSNDDLFRQNAVVACIPNSRWDLKSIQEVSKIIDSLIHLLNLGILKDWECISKLNDDEQVDSQEIGDVLKYLEQNLD